MIPVFRMLHYREVRANDAPIVPVPRKGRSGAWVRQPSDKDPRKGVQQAEGMLAPRSRTANESPAPKSKRFGCTSVFGVASRGCPVLAGLPKVLIASTELRAAQGYDGVRAIDGPGHASARLSRVPTTTLQPASRTPVAYTSPACEISGSAIGRGTIRYVDCK
jgi:hypothetical protein